MLLFTVFSDTVVLFQQCSKYRRSPLSADFVSANPLIHKCKISLKQFFATAPAAWNNDAQFKSGQKWFENNHLALLVFICDTLCSSSYLGRHHLNKGNTTLSPKMLRIFHFLFKKVWLLLDLMLFNFATSKKVFMGQKVFTQLWLWNLKDKLSHKYISDALLQFRLNYYFWSK